MEFSAKYIASLLNGEVIGDEETKVNNVSRIEEGKPGTLSFLANPKYESYIYSTNSSIVLVNKDFQPTSKISSTLIKVSNAYESFASLLEFYNGYADKIKVGIDKNSFIDPSSKYGEGTFVGAFSFIDKNVIIGNNVKIFPQVFVGDGVTIGDDTILYPGVKIYKNCVIGKSCTFHSGVVIGGDGFGFAKCSDDNYKKVPQVGNVIIEDFVEIGSNSTIDRATLGSTIIRKGVKIDNLIQIAHNVEIGENTVIAAQTGISGSTKIGKNCMIGGQVGIVGHITIADNVKIAAQSGIASSIKTEGDVVQGSPAFKVVPYQKSYVAFRKLPDLITQMNNLQRELDEIKSKLKD